ncbi:MAG TPA: aminoacyl-tRNA hydrolase [Deltaproteobacteria bacterium]|nr:aminoacyl-tRNA hydrolase [Deltaproteobacteria bacterium]
MKLIYGLGNPGKRYEYTRHNIGFLVADFLADKWRIPMKPAGGELVCGKGQIMKVPVVLAKPQTYMNLSGEPLRGRKIAAEDLIVIHDDLDLPAGTVRVKQGGGTGGHKGLESVFSALGDNGFVRIRCGIGRPFDGCDASDYVLGIFPKEDIDLVKEQIFDAASAVEMCLKEGVVKAMNTFNRRDKTTPEE